MCLLLLSVYLYLWLQESLRPEGHTLEEGGEEEDDDVDKDEEEEEEEEVEEKVEEEVDKERDGMKDRDRVDQGIGTIDTPPPHQVGCKILLKLYPTSRFKSNDPCQLDQKFYDTVWQALFWKYCLKLCM